MKKISLFLTMVLFLSCSAYAAKIDLSVTSSDVAISPAQPSSTSAITVTVKVYNLGTKASKANYLQLKIMKGTTKAYKVKNSIPAIPAGGFIESVFNVGILAAGSYTATVKADPANSMAEISEANNKVVLTMTVSGGGTTGGVGQAAGAVYAGTQFAFSSMFDTFSAGMGGGASGFQDYSNGIPGVLSIHEFARKLIENRSETTVACSKSGSYEMIYSLDSTMLRPSKIEFTYNNCQKWIDQPQGTYFEGSGAISMDLTYVSDNVLDPDFDHISQMILKAGDGNPSSDTAPDYTTSYYGPSGMTETFVSDYTMTVTIFGYNGDVPANMGILISGVQQWTEYLTNVTITSSMTGFHLDTTISGTENDMTTTSVAAGTISFTNSLHSCQNYTATYNNLNFTDHSTNLQSETTVVGQVVYSSNAFSGTFSITTIEPVITPNSEECPVSGRLSVSGSMGNATIIYNSDGTIGIDEGSNGSVDITYTYCNDAVDGAPC